jgi:hypothetical protein
VGGRQPRGRGVGGVSGLLNQPPEQVGVALEEGWIRGEASAAFP